MTFTASTLPKPDRGHEKTKRNCREPKGRTKKNDTNAKEVSIVRIVTDLYSLCFSLKKLLTTLLPDEFFCDQSDGDTSESVVP